MSDEKPRILIVDDDEAILGLLGSFLHKWGYISTTAVESGQALKLIMAQKFDVILSDVMMPGDIDGIELLKKVHQHNPDLPVILVTGYAQLQIAINAIKNGAFDFIHKPIDFDYLHQIIKRALFFADMKRREKNFQAELLLQVESKTAELKEAMRELDQARGDLIRIATEKSEFMATISHEMRTPMNGVIGALDLLSESALSETQAEYTGIARQSAETMVALIDELLTFEHPDNHEEGVCCDLMDLQMQMSALLENFRPKFAARGLSLSLYIDPEVQNDVWTDGERFRRVIEIFVGNALKFTDKGGAIIDVSCRGNKTEKSLLITVSDSGIGIPEEMEERIFEPFVQAETVLTRKYGGAGLGLAIARQNALLLGGKVWAERLPDGGSRFSFQMQIMSHV